MSITAKRRTDETMNGPHGTNAKSVGLQESLQSSFVVDYPSVEAKQTANNLTVYRQTETVIALKPYFKQVPNYSLKFDILSVFIHFPSALLISFVTSECISIPSNLLGYFLISKRILLIISKEL